MRLVGPGDVPLAVCFRPFGDLSIRTLAGHGILIQPTASLIYVTEGIPDEPLFLQMGIAGIIAGDRDLARGPDLITDVDGKGLTPRGTRRSSGASACSLFRPWP